VSEYDFYNHGQAVGAVSYAEVLGTFAREGMTLATAWAPPSPSEAAFAAYRLFGNFDGAGGRFEGSSVRATGSGGSGGQADAAIGPGGMTVALVNETAGSVPVSVGMGAFVASGSAAAVYANAGGATVTRQADAPVTGGTATLTLGPTSIAML